MSNAEFVLQIVDLIRRHLSLSADAQVIIATKRYYFGVGGGSFDFANAVTKSNEVSVDRKLACEVVTSLEDGASNIREIIVVRWLL